MKVQERRSSNEFSKKYDYRSMLEIDVDGRQEFRFLDGEPEDAILARDFNDAYKIVKMLERAYDAGYKREGFEVVSAEVDDFD